MDDNKPSLLISFVVSFILCLVSCYTSRRRRGRQNNLPPGPPRFPIVGNLFQLTGIFHRTLAKLSQKHGALMSITLLKRTIVVVSSPKVAKELFQKYDHTFIQTQVFDSNRALDHNKFSVIFLHAERQWRNLRKLSKEVVFSSERLNASMGLRQEKVQQLGDYIQACCFSEEVVDIRAVSFTTILNFLSNTFFSVDFAHYSDASHELQQVVQDLIDNFGKLNLADFFPVLQCIDPQGIRRQATRYFGKLLETIDDILSQRMKERDSQLANSSNKNDLVDVLLEKCRQDDSDWSYNHIKHWIVDLLIAGTHTISVTTEWAMAELLRNPEKMMKITAEIREVMGHGTEQIQESDISMLPYLHAVVKETLRLHPAVTITGRTPSDDIQIDEYTVPKDSKILINIWAINRDSSTWSDPDSFVPERFLDCNIDMKGQHFELLPFGAGRRVCPGQPLAHRMLHLMLASLLHKFDWMLPDGVEPEDMDMNEKTGYLSPKAIPLKAIPTLTMG